MAKTATTKEKSVVKKPRKQRNILLTMGKAYETSSDFTTVIATVPLYLHITQKMIDKAVGKSPRWCVVAQALEALFGKRVDFQVGAGITKIWDVKDKIEVRWHTSSPLAAGIRKFDKARGTWDLPPNIYKLNPMPKSLRPEAQKKSKKELVSLRARFAKKVGVRGGTFVVVNSAKKPKPKAKPTRTVLRNSRIKLPD